jgi:hypothetical protein
MQGWYVHNCSEQGGSMQWTQRSSDLVCLWEARESYSSQSEFQICRYDFDGCRSGLELQDDRPMQRRNIHHSFHQSWRLQRAQGHSELVFN